MHEQEALNTQRSFADIATCTEAATNVELSNDEVERSAAIYESFRQEQDGAVKIGLYGDDLRIAMQDLGTVMVKYAVQTEVQPVHMPVLVPINGLEWYNLPYLHEKYGEDAQLYCYVHPPIPGDEGSREVIASAVKDVLDSGAVVLLDQYQGASPFDSKNWVPDDMPEDSNGTIVRLRNNEDIYELESMNSNGRLKKSDVFVCPIDFDGIDVVKEAPSIYDTYQRAVENGELIIDAQNGPSIERVMSVNDMQKVWDIYEKPFERLSKGNPVLAGFDEGSLKYMLADPDIVKMVNRKDGDITTLLIFTQNFNHYPWFNEEYFKRTYPDYYDTGNILLCPGIVSDEAKRGTAFSWSLVDLLVKVAAKRETNAALSFECTEISTRYIPTKVVARGVEASGIATARGYDEPVATMEYKALRKSSDS
jgi:hypothetical protein